MSAADPCPDMGECSMCSQPLCTECGGDADPFECMGADEQHCGSCAASCDLCSDALEDDRSEAADVAREGWAS